MKFFTETSRLSVFERITAIAPGECSESRINGRNVRQTPREGVSGIGFRVNRPVLFAEDRDVPAENRALVRRHRCDHEALRSAAASLLAA